jgi:hypothetical protein
MMNSVTMIGITKIGAVKNVNMKIGITTTDAMRISIAKNGIETSPVTMICIKKARSMTIGVEATGSKSTGWKECYITLVHQLITAGT